MEVVESTTVVVVGVVKTGELDSTLQVLGKAFLPVAGAAFVDSGSLDLPLTAFLALLFPDLGLRPRFLPTLGVKAVDAPTLEEALEEIVDGVDLGSEARSASAVSSVNSAISPLTAVSGSSRVIEEERLCLAAEPICRK